jgi:hypothetical protein
MLVSLKVYEMLFAPSCSQVGGAKFTYVFDEDYWPPKTTVPSKSQDVALPRFGGQVNCFFIHERLLA